MDQQFFVLAEADGRPPVIPAIQRLSVIQIRAQETDNDAFHQAYLIR
jgi:hypothetical protein